MKILAVSDIVVDWIYNPKIRQLFSDIDLAIGCGDLPQNYLEFIVSTLDIPVFFVHGNHSQVDAQEIVNDRYSRGSVDIHCKMVRLKGYTFAGVEGCIRYKDGRFLYSQFDMWLNVFRLVPSLLLNRINLGHYLNVFVSHAPPWGIQDQSDYAHQGIKAFRWLLNRFQPEYHLHGHIHIYHPDTSVESQFGKTKVVNAFGYQKIEL
jgi:Icc-related predicted phosphoesterase